jgi:transposase-like protein
MYQNPNIISPEKKSQILADLAIPGYSVKELAKIYKVSTTSIYNLQRVAQGIRDIRVVERSNNFVELSVKDSTNSTLEKASLTFDNFSFSIEGKVTSASLIAIIKILEAQSY